VPPDLSNTADEVWGWDLSVIAEYRPRNGGFVGTGALKRIFLFISQLPMNSQGHSLRQLA
jgi:hypothetical protein